MLKGIAFFFCGALILGCTKGPDSKVEMFDTASFFKGQVEILKKGKYGLDKTMSFGEKKDHLHLDSLNWDMELAAFISLDLRKPAYKKRFLVDSTISQNDLVVHYHRNDKGTDIEDVWIHKQDSMVTKIKIVFAEQNQLYASGKELTFNANQGFEISGSQSVKLSTPFEYQVIGVFKKPSVNQ